MNADVGFGDQDGKDIGIDLLNDLWEIEGPGVYAR